MSQSWDAKNYASHASFVAEYGSSVLALLTPMQGERVLDLGCGDGALTLKIVETGANVYAVDSSESMVKSAKARGLNAEVKNGETITIWGDGNQTRSFLYIDECVFATKKLLRSNFQGPLNIGSEEMVTINNLVDLVASIAEKEIKVKHIDGPLGVRGRNSDNKLIDEKLNWSPTMKLADGLKLTYNWINSQVNS